MRELPDIEDDFVDYPVAVRRAWKRFRNSAQRVIIEHTSEWSRSREISRAAKAPSGPAALPRPDFIIIGAPKCGTSWLRGVLGQHPQVAMVSDEIEYFTSYLNQPLAWYASHFAAERLMPAGRSLPPGSIIGEKSASYCALPSNRIKMVHRFVPGAKLVLMIRDPVSRHWSHAKQYFFKLRHTDTERERLADMPRRRLFHFFKRTQRFGEFSAMLDNWEAFYPSDRFLVVPQEEAFADPRGALDRVLKHVGATGPYNPDKLKLLNKRKNIGPSVPMPDDVRRFLEDMFGSERERLKSKFGAGIFAPRPPAEAAVANSQ